MTEFVKNNNTTNKTNAEKRLAPFVRFGAFDLDNYKKKDQAAALEKERKYSPIRMVEGETIYGNITGFYTMGANGDVMYLKDVEINRRMPDGGMHLQQIEGLVKIGISPPDLKYHLIDKSKAIGDKIKITYLGLKDSPSNKDRTLHKFILE